MDNNKLNATDKIAFPDINAWASFFERWHDKLVDGLDGRFPKADREDAVARAFVKLMAKPEAAYEGHAPETEKDWYGNIRWQAKACLSHVAVSRDTWEKYHRQATEEGYLTSSVPGFNGLDLSVRNAALRRTLDELCDEAGIKPANVAAYVRWYLEGNPSDEVAEAFGTTANNLHAIRFRIEKLLRKKGAARFCAVRRRLFHEAA